MTAAELMARCENAVRTGQTENLFPVLAARTLQQIDTEKQENRRQWVKAEPLKGFEFAFEAVADAVRPVVDAFRSFIDAVTSTDWFPDSSDIELCEACDGSGYAPEILRFDGNVINPYESCEYCDGEGVQS